MVLANSNAGWATDQEDIGICHAELATALATAPGKVRLISLGNIKAEKSKEGRRNTRFQEYLARQSLFRGGAVKSIEELKQRPRCALRPIPISRFD